MTAVLGIDGGGRKTHAAVADIDGTLLGVGQAGASNWEIVGLDAALVGIAEASDRALESAGIERGAVDAAVFGLAGLDWPADEEQMQAALDAFGFGGRRRLVNDAFVALRAGCAQPWGVVVIAGTGTVVAGRDPAGREYRTLGLGRVFGDFGSEFDVSELAVRAVADAYTGRGPSTMLTDLLCARSGEATTERLLERISRADTRLRSPEVANMAPLVLEATETGDLVARQILEEIGQALGVTAGHVATRLGMEDLEFTVALAGGLFRTPNRYLLDQLELGVRRTAPQASPLILSAPPVVGAVLIALELAGPEVRAGLAPRLAADVTRAMKEAPS
ncbi:MAG: BadF/BadG/BcrA/BcrD ATPase family protein [Actinomycetota bacterium]